MGFVKEFRNFGEEMPEWEYLTSIGITDIYGEQIGKHVLSLVFDKQNNYYLVPQGHTGLAYTSEDIDFYILSLDGKKVQIETVEKTTKNEDKTVDTVFNVKKITIQDKEVEDIYSKDDLIKLVKEALMARAKFQEDDYCKNGKVDINI